jgi:hypothetical protein
MDTKSKTKYNFGFFIILFVIIGYFHLFRLSVLPSSFNKLAGIIAVLIIITFLILKFIYKNEPELPKNFLLPVILILISALISPIMALSYNGQPYFLSIWISFNLFFYLFYFFLHSVKIDKESLEKIIINIGLVAIMLFYIQYFLYPVRIFDETVKMTIARGTLRLWVPAMSFAIFSYFYFLDNFFRKNSFRFILMALLAFSIVVLNATRQLIAAMALLTIIFLFRSKEVKSRLLISALVVVGFFALFFSFYDIFMELYLVSQNQAETVEDNVRVRAARYFLTEFMPNDLAYFLGNADGHESSPYGVKLLKLKLINGFYLSDIGLVGDYVRYGVIFLLGAIIMLIRLITIKVDREYEYMRYYILLVLFTLVTGGGDFGGPNIAIILIAYLFDIGHHKYKSAKS